MNFFVEYCEKIMKLDNKKLQLVFRAQTVAFKHISVTE